MIEYFSGVAKTAADKGIDYIISNKRFKLEVEALAEKLKRELKFNIEVIDEIIKQSKLKNIEDKQKLISMFSLVKNKTFSNIDSGIIPLKFYFPKEISISKNEKYFYRMKSIKHLSDLIEKSYLRLELIKFQFNHGGINSDLNYLKFLLLKTIRELQ